MDKAEYLVNLFNNIKDEIEFDSDILAIASIIKTMLQIDASKGIENWLYIFENYPINNLKRDLDFTPILKDIPLKLISKLGFVSFFEMIDTLNNENQDLIFQHIFNIYSLEFSIGEFIVNLSENKSEKELHIIKLIIQKSPKYPPGIFEIKDFLQKIIQYHLTLPNKNFKLLQEMTELTTNLKEQSVLKALLLDYEPFSSQ